MSDIRVATRTGLTADEAERYRRRGYVTPAWRLPDATLARLRDAVEKLVAINAAKRPEQIVCPHVIGGADGELARDPELAQTFLDVALDPAILDLVEPALGPDILLWGSQLFCKPSGDGMAVPWHQDGHYWPIRPLAAASVWIAIDRSGPENGCLRVVPGSHAGGLIDHGHSDDQDLALDETLSEDSFDADSAEDVVLEPGQVSVHDPFLIHGSNPNRSVHRRAAWVLRFMPATSLFDREEPTYVTANGHRTNYADRPIWLARGRNRNPGNRFETRHESAPGG